MCNFSGLTVKAMNDSLDDCYHLKLKNLSFNFMFLVQFLPSVLSSYHLEWSHNYEEENECCVMILNNGCQG